MITRTNGRLRSHGRYDYSPIVGRPRFEWPGGKRLAVYVALNLEHYAFREGLVEELVPGMPQPDVLNHSWREYGNRVGAWRLARLFDALSLPATVLVNSDLYAHCPELIAGFRARGDEIAAHGSTNSERQSDFDADAEQRSRAAQDAFFAEVLLGRAPEPVAGDPATLVRDFHAAVWGKRDPRPSSGSSRQSSGPRSCPPPRPGAPVLGPRSWTSFVAAFPDLTAEVLDVRASGDLVTVLWRLRGTHGGPFLGHEPTGKAVDLEVVDVFRVAGGRLGEHLPPEPVWKQPDPGSHGKPRHTGLSRG